MVELTITSRRGLVGGVVLALAIPVGLWVLAQLIEHGLLPYEQLHSALVPLLNLALLEVALGPIGLAIAGWSAGARSGLAWLALVVVALPALAFAWVVAVVTLSGALGEPL